MHADDTVILPDSFEGLQVMLDSIREGEEEMDIKIIVNKTKILVYISNPQPGARLQLNGISDERVCSPILVLGTIITD